MQSLRAFSYIRTLLKIHIISQMLREKHIDFMGTFFLNPGITYKYIVIKSLIIRCKKTFNGISFWCEKTADDTVERIWRSGKIFHPVGAALQ